MSMYGMYAIPLEAQYLYRRGVDLLEQKKDEAAVKYLRQAIIIAPRFTGAYRELATCLSRTGRMEEAAACSMKLGQITSSGTCDWVQSRV